MANIFQLDIVSPEERIFTGLVQKVFVTGIQGELEILSNHAPLLTELSPGPVWLVKADGTEEGFVIFGGMLEVQPHMTNILADSAVRAENIDEASAISANQSAERAISSHDADFDYARAQSELLAAAAQLRLIRKIRDLAK
jgi:F-type H+-transporting ATPase subunit epsilon